MTIEFNDYQSAINFLIKLGASEKLIKHASLVNEAAQMLINRLHMLNIPINEKLITSGAVFHDVGKIIHANELSASGHEHEPDGEKLLLAKGVDAKIARCCISHARWSEMECSLEELLIALSDKLWKGVRVERLESMVTDRIASLTGHQHWEIFMELDTCFEAIANDGIERLGRS